MAIRTMTGTCRRVAGVLMACSLVFSCSGSSAPKSGATSPSIDGANGHTYRLVIVPGGITWVAAQAAAVAAGGHLATISDVAESGLLSAFSTAYSTAWVQITMGGNPATLLGPWLGGSAVGGQWSWVTGESWAYEDWASGEPTGTYMGVVEDKLIFEGATDANGALRATGWNDTGDFAAPSYLIEFDGPAPVAGGAGASQGVTGDFASCDSAVNGHEAPGEHACTEWTGKSVGSGLPAIMEQCPASMGYTFSTTTRCPTSEPGCICVTGSASLEQHVYIYQTALQDPFEIAHLLCGSPVESCFGGLTAPDGGSAD